MSSADLDAGMTSEDESVLYVPPRLAAEPYGDGEINEHLRAASAWMRPDRPAVSVHSAMAGGLYIDQTALRPLSEAGARQLIAPAAPQRLPAQMHRCFGCLSMFPASQVLIETELPAGLIERCFNCIQNGSPVEHLSILSKAASL